MIKPYSICQVLESLCPECDKKSLWYASAHRATYMDEAEPAALQCYGCGWEAEPDEIEQYLPSEPE